MLKTSRLYYYYASTKTVRIRYDSKGVCTEDFWVPTFKPSVSGEFFDVSTITSFGYLYVPGWSFIYLFESWVGVVRPIDTQHVVKKSGICDFVLGNLFKTWYHNLTFQYNLGESPSSVSWRVRVLTKHNRLCIIRRMHVCAFLVSKTCTEKTDSE